MLVTNLLNKSQKQTIVKELSLKFKSAKIAIFSDFHGVSVAKSQALRRLLRQNDTEYKVSKKTLLDRALNDAGIALKTKELKGEVGVALGNGDEVAPAKTLVKFSKENETFKILGGILGSRILTEKEVLALSKLPNKEVMIAQVVGTLAAPLRGLVTVLSGNTRNLVVVLNKIREKQIK